MRLRLKRPSRRLVAGIVALGMLAVFWYCEQVRLAREEWVARLQSPGLYVREITWSSSGRGASVLHRLELLVTGGQIHIASQTPTQTKRLLNAAPDPRRNFRITLHYDPRQEELTAIRELLPKSSLFVVLPGANTGRRVW